MFMQKKTAGIFLMGTNAIEKGQNIFSSEFPLCVRSLPNYVAYRRVVSLTWTRFSCTSPKNSHDHKAPTKPSVSNFSHDLSTGQAASFAENCSDALASFVKVRAQNGNLCCIINFLETFITQQIVQNNEIMSNNKPKKQTFFRHNCGYPNFGWLTFAYY